MNNTIIIRSESDDFPISYAASLFDELLIIERTPRTLLVSSIPDSIKEIVEKNYIIQENKINYTTL